ncbi:MAG TPA: hypothetical protein VMR54_15995 [Thermoanaerobaculia bacterium]|nr:hypothetical protein [Thermoanaerobaculia bacterium]
MKTRRGLAAFLIAGGLCAAPASAQFVQLTRCHGAYPCNQPFGLEYNPDPLIAGPWSQGAPTSAVSAHVELNSKPKVVLDKPEPAPLSDPIGPSVRAFLKKYPAPKKAKSEEPAAAAKPAEPAKP